MPWASGPILKPWPMRPGNLGCQSVAFTYNDPVVWAEYAIDLRQGMPCGGREDGGGYCRVYHALGTQDVL